MNTSTPIPSIARALATHSNQRAMVCTVGAGRTWGTFDASPGADALPTTIARAVPPRAELLKAAERCPPPQGWFDQQDDPFTPA